MEQIAAMLIIVLFVIVTKVDIVYAADKPKPITPLEKRINPHTATALSWLNNPSGVPNNQEWHKIINQLLNDDNLILDHMNPGEAEKVLEALKAAVMGYIMTNPKEEMF